jgi:hypothetical protein
MGSLILEFHTHTFFKLDCHYHPPYLAIQGRNALVVLPTGGGKSMCFIIPALISGKTTLVISPLIALMEDQVCTTAQRLRKVKERAGHHVGWGVGPCGVWGTLKPKT